MPRKKNLWGNHLVTAREVAKCITSVHESTIRRWMKNGVTGFGLPLDVSVKDNHRVISLFEVHRLQDELQRRELDAFVRETDAFETELHRPDRAPGEWRLPKKSKSPRL
jgi:hypothetical protein